MSHVQGPKSKVKNMTRRRPDLGLVTLDFGMRVRNAYTLMELLLVLAIIVIAAAAVAPSIDGFRRSAVIRSGANDIRAALTKAHVVAMRTGRTQVFQYELGGGKYKTEPYVGGDDAIESVQGDQSSPLASSTSHPAHEKTLPEGMKFAAGDAAVESRAERIEREASSTGGGGVSWSRPLLFFPDGSSVDAFIVVGNTHDRGIRLDLRGMTAAVKVSEVSEVKSLENSAPVSR
jgi:prepilin-type N-terminal cleavage/methylation domain-containing protein